MKFVPIKDVQAEMVLAQPVTSSDGRVLLNEGVSLTPSYLRRLRSLGLPGIYISTPETAGIQIPETISKATRQAAIGELKNVYDSVRLGKTFDMRPIQQRVNGIIDEMARNPQVLSGLSDIRTYDGYTFSHSVNVCVLSTMIGLHMNLNELQMKELAVGALLHDIGKTLVPDQIILKPGKLTDEEMNEAQKHSFYGWELLRQHPEISLHSAHVAYQHHERPNGEGYPRALKDTGISVYARIVGAADAYDAMTSDRSYQQGRLPSEALEVLQDLRGEQFNDEVTDLLLKLVAPYPVGCMVTLNTRERGVVVDVNHQEPYRPVVRLLYRASGKEFREYTEVDLAAERYLSIEESYR